MSVETYFEVENKAISFENLRSFSSNQSSGINNDFSERNHKKTEAMTKLNSNGPSVATACTFSNSYVPGSLKANKLLQYISNLPKADVSRSWAVCQTCDAVVRKF